MRTVNKALALIFVFAVLSSLMVITVKPVDAQATFKPSVPEFTVKLVDYSYDVPPTTTTNTNPYTGEKTTTNTPGYRVENKTIEITITNQPYKPYTNKDGYECNLYYQIEYKGHFSDEWQKCGSEREQSSSQYTTAQWRPYYPFAVGYQVDFRVEAKVGYIVMVPGTPGSFWPLFPTFTTESSSGWSNVQMFTMPGESSTPWPSQTATQPTNPPTNPSTTSNNNQPQASTYYSSTQETIMLVPYSGIIILLCVIVLTIGIIVALTVVLLLRRHPKTTNPQPQQPIETE